ncbi:PilZ domain-containing protein [Sphingomonas sp. ASV193]|uniref:PilZ domain-containing protein n=1 Tax=Sphingomonas sp. ASV193 TaxID=3144405 RepID=UPI0032E89C8E
MGSVTVFERARESVADSLARRGHHIVYRTNSDNRCPGCGRANWYIGRVSAECGFCGTAVPLAEARTDGEAARATVTAADQRRHKRLPTGKRHLHLLVDGTPASFAMHNISAGGAMGGSEAHLAVGATVEVRFEGGILIPATVRWAEDGLVGLEFGAPIKLDARRQ